MTIQKKTDKFFSSVLPEKLLKILQDYDDFTANPAPNDTKSFGAYHLACKNALSHIILLSRLLETKQHEDNQTQEWLAKAKTAIMDEDDENMYGDIDGICMDME